MKRRNQIATHCERLARGLIGPWGLVAAVLVLPAGLGASSLMAQAEETTTARQEVSDGDITRAIDSEFWADEVVNANAIDINTKSGIVTLKGTATSLLAKERAEKIASSIVGVRAVVNTVNVQPLNPPTDAGLQDSVRRALARDPATESYEVVATVRDGVVTLTGTVDSWQESQLCSTVTKGVSGVVGVKNKIKVDYETDRPDIEIKPEVEGRLANDVLVDDHLINVDVNDGKVKLTGTVGSLSEKVRARTDAWVTGVQAVDANALKIRWWARDEMRRKSLYQSRTDSEIRRAVKDAFLYDPRVFSFKPNVFVENRAVTLTGVVDNLEAKRAAEDDAKNVVGVLRVKNRLKVRPEIAPSNEELEDRVEWALLTDPYLELAEIDVDAQYGTVKLSGDVNTSFEKNHAEQVAEGVRGVANVINTLSYQYAWEWKADWEIRSDVKDQLFWSIHVDEDEINVKVDDGVATLTGEVDSWHERQAAERNAYEGGAKDVRNLITIDYEPLFSARD